MQICTVDLQRTWTTQFQSKCDLPPDSLQPASVHTDLFYNLRSKIGHYTSDHFISLSLQFCWLVRFCLRTGCVYIFTDSLLIIPHQYITFFCCCRCFSVCNMKNNHKKSFYHVSNVKLISGRRCPSRVEKP